MSLGETIGLTVLGLFVLIIIIVYVCKCYSDYTVGRFRDKSSPDSVINDLGLSLLIPTDKSTNLNPPNENVDIHYDPYRDADVGKGDYNDFSLVIESHRRNSLHNLKQKAAISGMQPPLIDEISSASMPQSSSYNHAESDSTLTSKSIEVEVQIHNKDHYTQSYKAQPAIPAKPNYSPAAPPPLPVLGKEPMPKLKPIDDPRHTFLRKSEPTNQWKNYPTGVQSPTQTTSEHTMIEKERGDYNPEIESQLIPSPPVFKPPSPPSRPKRTVLPQDIAVPSYHDVVSKKPAQSPKPQTPKIPGVTSKMPKEKNHITSNESVKKKDVADDASKPRTPKTAKKSRKVPDHLVTKDGMKEDGKPKTPKTPKKVRKASEDDFGLVTSPSQLKVRKPKPKPAPPEDISKPLDDITNGQRSPVKARSYKTNMYSEQMSYEGDQNSGDFIDTICSPKMQQKPFTYNGTEDYNLSPHLQHNANSRTSNI